MTYILAAIAKRSKNAEQKIRMSRKTTKAYLRMVRRMTQTDGFYVGITGQFAIAASIHTFPAVAVVIFVLVKYFPHFIYKRFIFPRFILAVRIVIKCGSADFQSSAIEADLPLNPAVIGLQSNEL